MSRLAVAGVVAVGEELLAGEHPDLDSPLIARALLPHGRQLAAVHVVPDDEQAIADAVTELATRVGLIFVTGGLGPTLDDVTRHGVARAAGVELRHSDEAWRGVQAWYARSGRDIPESNRRQALIPLGASVLHNRVGTAPGFRCRIGDAELFALPGPPRELEEMLDHEVDPWLRQHPLEGEHLAIHHFYLAGLSESVFAEQAGDWMERGSNPLIGCTVKSGVLHARLLAHAETPERAQALVDGRSRAFRERFKEHIFSEEDADPAHALGRVLLEKNLSVTCAESCTGGMVAAALTRVAGISAVFPGAEVTYSNQAKSRLLGVAPELLERHGAVSAPVAEAMARGAAQRYGARLALSVTGIAGPGGGSSEKPVGLVWFGVCLDGEVRTLERRWPPAGRERVRAWATTQALVLLLEAARRA